MAASIPISSTSAATSTSAQTRSFSSWGRYSQKSFPVVSAEQLLVPSSQNVNTNKVLRVDTNWTISPNLINEGGYAFTRVCDRR